MNPEHRCRWLDAAWRDYSQSASETAGLALIEHSTLPVTGASHGRCGSSIVASVMEPIIDY
jgi:hypothetical protein